MRSLQEAILYGILDLGYTPVTRAAEVTRALIAGGIDILQLRAKHSDLATIRHVATLLLPFCREAGIPFILNDYPELAGQLGADGVHIGQDDGSRADALALLQRGFRSVPSHSSSPTPVFLIGRSTHSLPQAHAAHEEGFDYIGFGPVFATPTKPGRPAIGLFDIATMEQEVGVHLPAFCIGGITHDTLSQVISAKARRVVVVSALLQAQDVTLATRAIRHALNETDSVQVGSGNLPPF